MWLASAGCLRRYTYSQKASAGSTRMGDPQAFSVLIDHLDHPPAVGQSAVKVPIRYHTNKKGPLVVSRVFETL